MTNVASLPGKSPARPNEAAPPAVGDLVLALAAMDAPAARAVLDRTTAAPLQKAETLIVPALEVLGNDWSAGRVALSQVYVAARICERLLDDLLPPESPARRNHPRAAIAVLEDHHVLGKRIVSSVLRASGWELCDLGRLGAEELVARVRAEEIRILLVSVLLFRSALKVREVRRLLDQGDIPVRLVVGGAPFTLDPDLWRTVGADDTGCNAAAAVAAVERMAASLDGGAR
jgi:methanogenic corrinoid protein MtbC1